ncbi:MAG: type IV pilus modification PilV family protein [Minisyncoccia bacterium]
MAQFIKKYKNGQVLIEAVIAVSILLTALIGVLALLSQALRLNNTVQYRIVASELAGEGIEYVRYLVDNNIASNKAWNSNINSGTYQVSMNCSSLSDSINRCGSVSNINAADYISLNSSDLYQYSQPKLATMFKRVVDINVSNTSMQVTSTVQWNLNNQTSTVSIADTFYDWRQ